MDISWIRPEQIVEFELIQLADENIDVQELQSEWDELKLQHADSVSLRAIEFQNKLEKLKKNNNDVLYEFIENLERNKNNKKLTLGSDILYDKILGGWNGRASGCLLGKPIEKYSKEIIKEILEANNSWPLNNYITSEGLPQDILDKYPWNKHSGRESLRENIECMTEDDDLNYTMMNLHVLEKYGSNFTTVNVANEWLELLPVLSTFTAERIVYKNLLLGNQVEDITLFNNPYREWIGAMIRADLWGWVSPGNPIQAIKFAFQDGSLTHVNNGVIGEMFLSAVVSLSFIYDDVNELLFESLQYIPQESKIYETVKFGIKCANENTNWEDVLEVLDSRYGNYHWVHSINNSALIAAALVFSKGDFGNAICNTVMGGWDTDSDAASVGAIIGTINGNEKLSAKWIGPLNNKIRSSMKGFDNQKISELSKRTINLIKE